MEKNYRSESSRSDDGQEQAAYWSLMHRPKISIRLRITLGFLLSFLLTCSITLTAVVFIEKLGVKQRFLEKANNFVFEIQQARRFEKNYFLYGTDLYDALNHVNTAQSLLNTHQKNFKSVIGDHSFQTISTGLDRYHTLLQELESKNLRHDPTFTPDNTKLESDLRRVGAEIVANALNVIDQERLRVHTWLNAYKFAAVVALVFILLLIVFMATFIIQQINRPFRRIEQYTKAIASGNFSPITPKRKYRDEFTNLAIALNRMQKEISDRTEQLIQSRKMVAVGTLTAGIAHEINNPLNNISLTTEALIDDIDLWEKDEILKMLKDIYTQVERASGTVANLLDFTHRDETSFEPLSINDVIQSTVQLVGNEIALNNTTLNLDLQENLPVVLGNHHNLQQVFLNLFLNSIQAMPDGGHLTVRSFTREQSVGVEVSDTGAGIPEDFLKKIFDPFFTTKEVGKGTGLGLSVSYGIIEKHHGVIEVESTVGHGTTFRVFLPVMTKKND